LLDAVNPYTMLTFGQVIFFLILILVSFMSSAAEVALFSLTRSDIEVLRNDPGKISQRIWQLVNEPKRLLATILLTNNFVNIAAILVASTVMHNVGLYHGWDRLNFAINLGLLHIDVPIQFLVNVILITAILLLFGEIIPKIYAARHYHEFVPFISGPLLLFKQILKPLSSLLIRTTRFIDHRLQNKENTASIEEIRHAIELTSVNPDHQEERNILKGIVNLSNITVKSIMRARVDVKAVEVSTPLIELLEYINEHN
jgi:CBS domain containing-hemolysin-like protein